MYGLAVMTVRDAVIVYLWVQLVVLIVLLVWLIKIAMEPDHYA